ncbi:MAG: cysteine desulfurase family protein [Myxococcota bacterium]
MQRIYLDHNATTPLRPEVVDAMMRVLREDFGNPSSIHWAGSAARDAVEAARSQVAAAVGCDPGCIVFTSGATEASNTVLQHAARRALAASPARQLVTCATEHPSVLDTARELRRGGLAVTVLPVEADGRLDPQLFSEALTRPTQLASVMWANNETGVLQPIPELAGRARDAGVAFHSDAVQVLGKLPLRLASEPVDFASFSAHKLGGPKGIGALYVRAGARVQPLLHGGPQERRRRAGTENVPGIVGFGAACVAAMRDLDERRRTLGALRDRLWRGIQETIPDAIANGAPAHRLPHVLSVSFVGADGEALVQALDMEGIAVAAGAACASGSLEPSHVLLAMGLSPEVGGGSIRISLGVGTVADHVERLLAVLPGIVERVRKETHP